MKKSETAIVPLPTRALAVRRENSLVARGSKDARQISRAEKRVRLIIIEEEQRILHFLRRGFEYEGYNLLGVAQNGEEGVELFRQTRPDVVIMDGMMPGMNGVEASRIILSEDTQTSVILISAWFGDRRARHYIQQSRMAGVSACLAKPFEWEELKAKVDIIASMPDGRPIEWRWVAPGPFLMGSGPYVRSIGYSESSAQPQHELQLYGFFMGRDPITNAEYHQFVKDGGYGQARYWAEARAAGRWNEDEGYIAAPVPLGCDAVDFCHPHHPKGSLSWYEARAFAFWTQDKLIETDEELVCGNELVGPRDLLVERGWRVILPSEPEWEKAARGTDGRLYPWGDGWNADAAQCYTGEPYPLYERRRYGSTSAIGAHSPRGDSPFGCRDMVGNVWEWTRSSPVPYPYDSEDSRENPSDKKVVRGASYVTRPEDGVESFRRNYVSSVFSFPYFGARLALTPGVC